MPDFVLYRPDNAASEKKADEALKEIVHRRKAAKQRSKIRTAKPKGAGKGSTPKSRSGSKTEKKQPRSGSRNDPSPPKSTPRGRR